MHRFLICCLLNLHVLTHTTGQIKDIVLTDGFINALHRAHAGQITFMNGNIPIEEYREVDFLTTFELIPASNLNIRVFMENSITNYLHLLAPDMSPDELIQKGNYQFTFIVDDKIIYIENLHHGAGLNKNTTTTFRIPFTSTKGEDYWGIYLWNRFMMRGGEQALSDGVHRLSVEIRPYLKVNDAAEVKIGELIAKGELQLIVKTPEVTEKEMAVQSILPGSDWPISKAKYHNEKIMELNKTILQNKYKEITSLIIIKNGKLLVEEYFNDAQRHTLHDTRSVGKSFTSTLMGIAIEDGYIKNIHQPLGSFYDLKQFEHYDSTKDNVQLKDLMTMSSAFDGSDVNGDSPGNEENMYPSDDWVKFTLNLPMDHSKINGRQWDYFTAGVVLLGDILHKSVPGGLEKYAANRLFNPLGISTHQWQYTPQQVVNTAGGLQLSALDYARYGQLYKNRGRWRGKQILPATWVDESFTKQLPIPGRPDEYYGYLFWNKSYTVQGKKYETFYCAGNGGSKIFVFKNLLVTVVITARAYNRAYGHTQVDQMMERFILPALLK